MSVERLTTKSAKRIGWFAALPKAFLAAVCAVVLLWAFYNDRLIATSGLEWLPRIKLRMEFNSLAFMLLFVPCTFALYALARGTIAANWVLGVASLAIYATVGTIYLIPLLFTCLFDYVVGAFLARSSNERLRTAAFVVSVAVQLSLLCTFKYAGWLTGEFNTLATAVGLGVVVTQIALPLPPGISFYTFHTISYTADIYQRKFKPTGSFIDYVTFVAFFPQLIAGPIARASELLPQIVKRTAGGVSRTMRASLHADRLGSLQENLPRR